MGSITGVTVSDMPLSPDANRLVATPPRANAPR